MWCLAQSTRPWQLVVLQSGPRCNLSASRFELLEGQEAGWQPVPIGLVAAGSIHLRLRATDYRQQRADPPEGAECWHRLRPGSCPSRPVARHIAAPWRVEEAISMRMEDVCGLAHRPSQCRLRRQQPYPRPIYTDLYVSRIPSLQSGRVMRFLPKARARQIVNRLEVMKDK